MLKREKILIILFIGTLILFLLKGYYIVYGTPETFPGSSSFSVRENETLRSVSDRLEEGGFINSALTFRMVVSFLGKDTKIQIGEYSFDHPVTLLYVVHKITSGKPDAPLVIVTVPEGSTLEQIASLFSQKLNLFSKDAFIQKVEERNLEGKLFPSTYYPLPSYTEDDVISIMHTTFQKKVDNRIATHLIPSPLVDGDEVLVLASLVEGEAKTPEDMRVIAGILIKRLAIGMPLQVDVATSTYKKKGLPEKAINSPGLNAINAVLVPTSSDFLYYITGNDGVMYYAKTFLEHRKNIVKYLK